jgi:hypothetical protein
MENHFLNRHINDLIAGLDFAKESGIALDRDYECGSYEFKIQYAIQNSSREITFAFCGIAINQETFDKILLLMRRRMDLLGESEAGRNQKDRLVRIIQSGMKQEPTLGIPEQFREHIPEALTLKNLVAYL